MAVVRHFADGASRDSVWNDCLYSWCVEGGPYARTRLACARARAGTLASATRHD